jgi:hypothetical protein
VNLVPDLAFPISLSSSALQEQQHMMEDGAKKQAGRRGFGYFFLSFFLGIPLLLGGSLLFWIFFLWFLAASRGIA